LDCRSHARPVGPELETNEPSPHYRILQLDFQSGPRAGTRASFPTYFGMKDTFKDFILSFEHTFYRKDYMFGQCFDHLSIEGKLLTTDILKFENLENDFKSFLKKYNIPPIKLRNDEPDNISGDDKTGPRSKKELTYDKEMIEIVERLFAKDLEYFGYKFNG